MTEDPDSTLVPDITDPGPTLGVRHWLQQALAGALGMALVLVLVAAWMSDPEPKDADDATRYATKALESIGFADPTVRSVAESVFAIDGGLSVSVWVTDLSVTGGSVQFLVPFRGPNAVQVTDTAVNGTALFTEEQFGELREDFRLDPPADRHRRRNVALTIATFAALGVTVSLAQYVWKSA